MARLSDFSTDLMGEELTAPTSVKIDTFSVAQVKPWGSDDDTEEVPKLYLNVRLPDGRKKRMGVGKTNLRVLIALFGDDTAQLPGKTIIVERGKKRLPQGGYPVSIKNQKVAPPAPKPTPPAEPQAETVKKPEPQTNAERWQAFIDDNGITAEHLQKALGGLTWMEWAKQNHKTMKDAMHAVLQQI